MSTGLSGTPMPTYRDSLPEADRWALAYYVLSLSAFKDPLTGETIKFTQADRERLNDPALKAAESRQAYATTQDVAEQPGVFAGEAWAKKHGFDFAAGP